MATLVTVATFYGWSGWLVWLECYNISRRHVWLITFTPTPAILAISHITGYAYASQRHMLLYYEWPTRH